MLHLIHRAQLKERPKIILVNKRKFLYQTQTLASLEMINSIFAQINPDYLVYFGTAGLSLGLIFFVVFVYRRIRRLISIFTSRKYSSPKLAASLKNLILILLWSSVFGMLLFVGFFLRAYHVFTFEKPVAKIEIMPTTEPQTMKVSFIQVSDQGLSLNKQFTIKGDQWLLEGDILKWDNWLNFLGLQTRYRFTRIRGRYLKTSDEIEKDKSVFSLVKEEDHPFWQYLYQYGNKLPFVSTVYGNAIFQYGNKHKKFLIFVTPSGFVVRETFI